MKILVTGASGFIGSFIVEEALRRGMDTWAAIRKSSSREFLQDERIHFIELDLSSKDKLVEQLEDHDFDYIVHAAGVTKCLRIEDFKKVNTEGTKNLVDAILQLQMPIKRFVYLSSLSIFGPIAEEKPHREITENDFPKPNTAYGKSKLEAEKYLDSIVIELMSYPEERRTINYYRLFAKVSTLRYLSYDYFRTTIFDCMSLLSKI